MAQPPRTPHLGCLLALNFGLPTARSAEPTRASRGWGARGVGGWGREDGGGEVTVGEYISLTHPSHPSSGASATKSHPNIPSLLRDLARPPEGCGRPRALPVRETSASPEPPVPRGEEVAGLPRKDRSTTSARIGDSPGAAPGRTRTLPSLPSPDGGSAARTRRHFTRYLGQPSRSARRTRTKSGILPPSSRSTHRYRPGGGKAEPLGHAYDSSAGPLVGALPLRPELGRQHSHPRAPVRSRSPEAVVIKAVTCRWKGGPRCPPVATRAAAFTFPAALKVSAASIADLQTMF
ncbi:uncharacterized protein LOC107314335 [Coturnix japonica]|uniref:uncharacterized protein LOC107314335 n=1 Tax=Coturnix japonica TaxID=93934 RepID=UPI000777A723|nr:uncharacterized protein LOC107314335 [Coturnix japonica]